MNTPGTANGVNGASAEDARIRQTELIIAQTLRIGVALSFGLIILGTVLMFAHHPEYFTSKEALGALVRGRDKPNSLAQVGHSVQAMRGRGMISLGLLILILTPVARVAISIIAFLVQKDTRFAWITTAVLGFLIASFLLGRAGG